MTIVVAAAVFAADIMTPLGRAVPAFYVGLILLSRTSRWPPFALILGVLATILTIVGYFLSPGQPAETALTDRAIAMAMIWITTILCFRHTQLAAQLTEAKRSLEKEVRVIETVAAKTTTALVAEQESRKRTEGELEEFEQRYEAVFNQTFEIMAVVARDGTLDRANETLLSLGRLNQGEVRGRPIWEIPLWNLRPDSQEALRAAVAAAADGNFFRHELSFNRIGGEEMVADFSMKPIRDESGEVDYLIFEARDITEHRRTQQIASQKQRLEILGTLASGIAHDFNNLLTVIGGSIELAERRLEEDSPARKRIGIALKGVFQGKSLTQQLLAIARKQELSPKAVELNGVLESVVELLDRTLPDTITIEPDVPAALWPCWADPTQLQAALLNLVVNARDAMPNGGSIRLRCSNVTVAADADAAHLAMEPGDYARIDVIDEGAGIPPEILDRVMEPFFTTKGPGEGSGLGLSMVYGFIRQSGGDVKISSRPGEGTTVSVFLPRARVVGAAPESDAAVTRGQGRILVLEDNAEVREVIVSMLKDLGHSVVEAADGAAALDQLRTNEPFDLLLTDVMIPGSVDPLEVARVGRAINARLKVLYSSADRHKAEALLDGEANDAAFIAKPYRYAELSNRVAALLSEAAPASS